MTKALETITNKIFESLDEGIAPWRKPWYSLEPCGWNGRQYSGINRLLLSFNTFDDNRYLTFNKGKQLGGSVRKGEHGFPVVYWDRKEKIDEDSLEVKRFMFMRLYYVFNVSQFDNLTLPKREIPTIEFVPAEEYERIISEWHNRPELKEGGNRAYYSPTFDNVQMPPAKFFESINAYYGTLSHEYVHATGHSSRINRFKDSDDPSSERYSLEELVAEIGSALLMGKAHMTIDWENSTSYIGTWLERLKDDRHMIITAASRAEKAVNSIIGTPADPDPVPITEERELVTA